MGLLCTKLGGAGTWGLLCIELRGAGTWAYSVQNLVELAHGPTMYRT